MISVEYLIGTVMSIGIIYFVGRRSLRSVKIDRMPSVRHRQSHIFEIVKPLLPPLDLAKKKRVLTQAQKYDKTVNVKVIILGNKAFWIKDNTLFMANITDDGIDKESASEVDTMGMSKVELDKMLFIVDQLTDRNE